MTTQCKDPACPSYGQMGATCTCGPAFDLIAHLHRQRAFSEKTFGPGARTKGVIDHIRKELAEIEAAPADIEEWVDVIILAFDGAWRAGWEPERIVEAIVAKQTKNEARQWPDWRTADPEKAIEHVRTDDARAT
ncbi:pyrophosphohydrolase [Microcystis phage vB_MweS-yong2]|nr:pyrophosphohydrolase [Microcystis phage vB_MweS-yong2]